MGLLERILPRRRQAPMKLDRAIAGARFFHERHLRGASWLGFFAMNNGVTLYTFYTANQGFSRVVDALGTSVAGMQRGETRSMHGLKIDCGGETESGQVAYGLSDNHGHVARIVLAEAVEDWKTGEVISKHRIIVKDGFDIAINQRWGDGSSYSSGSTSHRNYGTYVSFFDRLKPFVQAVGSRGNEGDSDFQKACDAVVDADGGLPGVICMREMDRMRADVASRYFAEIAPDMLDIAHELVESGFLFGKNKLVHDRMEMFAFEPKGDGVDIVLLNQRAGVGSPCLFSLKTNGKRRLSAIEVRLLQADGFGRDPVMAYDVSKGTLRWSPGVDIPVVAEPALRAIHAAREVLCGRKIDYSAFAAFTTSEEFRGYEAFEDSGASLSLK